MGETKSFSNFDFIYQLPGNLVVTPLKIFSIDKRFSDQLAFCFEIFRILHFAEKYSAEIDDELYHLGETFYDICVFILNYIPLYLIVYAFLFRICYIAAKFGHSIGEKLDLLIRIRIWIVVITLFYYDLYKFEFFAHLLTPFLLLALLKCMLNNFNTYFRECLEDCLASLLLHLILRHYFSNKLAMTVFFEWIFMFLSCLCNAGVCAASCYYLYNKTSELLQNKHSPRVYFKKMQEKAMWLLAATLFNVLTYFFQKSRHYHIVFYYFSLAIEAVIFTAVNLETNIGLMITLPNSLISIFLSLLLALYFELV